MNDFNKLKEEAERLHKIANIIKVTNKDNSEEIEREINEIETIIKICELFTTKK